MILVVDDDPAFLEKAREILNRERQVFFAADAKQAFKLAGNLGFSVVLVDLDLRGPSGLELIGQLHQRFPDLPVIAISGAAFQSEQAKKAGAIEVLQKPATLAWKPVVERVRATALRH